MVLGRKARMREPPPPSSLNGEGALEIVGFPSLTLGEGVGGAAENSCCRIPWEGLLWISGPHLDSWQDGELVSLSPSRDVRSTPWCPLTITFLGRSLQQVYRAQTGNRGEFMSV